MKWYIIGSVASGKSTMARQLSERTGVTWYPLDEVVHGPDPASSWGNRKRTEEERERLFSRILAHSSYIIEDTGRACFVRGMEEADVIVLLNPPLWIRKKRIVSRLLKQKLGWEACSYRPHWGVLQDMFRWAQNFETGKDGVKERAQRFSHKVVVLRSKKEIRGYLNSLENESPEKKQTHPDG